MREDLLGYLLGALDAAEQEQVERRLDANPALHEEVQALQARLEALGETYQEYEPPRGLADRTCSLVVAHQQTAHIVPAGRIRQTPSEPSTSSTRRWNYGDVFVAAGVMLVAACLFFPALANSRFAAQRITCEDNLRQIGLALQAYSDRYSGRTFPYVPSSGNRAFAGVFAPTLVECELIGDSSLFICPSSAQVEGLDQWEMPSLAEIDAAAQEDLIRIRPLAAGSYGYNLGVDVDGRHRAPRNQGRASFALVSDAPSLHLPDRSSPNHGGLGQNLLYEDGHVKFIKGCVGQQCVDHPFLSRRGFVESGRDVNDVVIGRSDSSPVITNVMLQP